VEVPDGRRSVPGPGAYDTDSRPHGPSFSLGSKPKSTIAASAVDLPGPASYDARPKAKGGFSMYGKLEHNYDNHQPGTCQLPLSSSHPW
jgi:hypothetical protein